MLHFFFISTSIFICIKTGVVHWNAYGTSNIVAAFEECMCRLRNIAMHDYHESVTTGQTHGQTPDKVIPMCRYASQATQKAKHDKWTDGRQKKLSLCCAFLHWRHKNTVQNSKWIGEERSQTLAINQAQTRSKVKLRLWKEWKGQGLWLQIMNTVYVNKQIFMWG